MFQGSILFGPWERIWKSWAPNKCRFFLWLVAHNRCWTADRLARRNLPHLDRCSLCDQEEETIHHLSPASFLTNSGVFYCSELALQGCLLNPLKHPLTMVEKGNQFSHQHTKGRAQFSANVGGMDSLAASEWLRFQWGFTQAVHNPSHGYEGSMGLMHGGGQGIVPAHC
jgi:hypothetical protein